MRAFLSLLLPLSLSAQGAGLDLDLRTRLGSDAAAGITLVPPGSWHGLLLGSTAAPVKQTRRSTPGKTVEVWDFALRESVLDTGFRLLKTDLREKLNRAWELPPPTHQSIELWEFQASDPSRPQELELDRVKSMQERFNRLPPSGSPVTTHRP
jgi:hypothetical protein